MSLFFSAIGDFYEGNGSMPVFSRGGDAHAALNGGFLDVKIFFRSARQDALVTDRPKEEVFRAL